MQKENVRIDPQNGDIFLNNFSNDALMYHKKRINRISKKMQGLSDIGKLLLKYDTIKNAFAQIADTNKGMKTVYQTYCQYEWFDTIEAHIIWLNSVVLLYKQLLTFPCKVNNGSKEVAKENGY
jgi:hypothetical protein